MPDDEPIKVHPVELSPEQLVRVAIKSSRPYMRHRAEPGPGAAPCFVVSSMLLKVAASPTHFKLLPQPPHA